MFFVVIRGNYSPGEIAAIPIEPVGDLTGLIHIGEKISWH
jgi:hypothetical protein